MQDMLKDKVAIITGSTSGMGEATAIDFAREGAKVVICGRNAQRAQEVVDRIVADGGEAVTFGTFDVEDMDSIKSTVAKTVEKFGRIDILAAFAGATFNNREDLTDDEMYEKTFAVNTKGVFDTVFAVIPTMKKQQSGNIILCSTNGAFNPITTPFEYHMAKGACESLAVNLAFDLAPDGIRVNCIKPGAIVTPFWDKLMPDSPERDALFDGIAGTEVPLGRMGTPQDISGVALFFASDLSAYVTGLCMYVAGGQGYIYSKNQGFLFGKVDMGKDMEE